MIKLGLNNVVNTIMFLYIISLYLFTYTEDFIVSNALALLLIASIWANFLLTRRKLVFNKLLFIFLLFTAICSFSVFYAIDQSVAITQVRTLILIFIVMLSLVNYIDSTEKLKAFMAYFIYAGCIASIYIFSANDFSQLTRFGSELGNVNAVGMIIGISATFCFYIMLHEKKFLYLLPFVIMTITILLTGSRKSLLFICMNIVIIIYLRNRHSLKGKLKFIIVSLIILIITSYLIFNIPIFYKIIGKRVENMLAFISGEGTRESSINMRAYMIQIGYEFFKDRPLTGYGINNYRILFSQVPGGRETYAHNNVIELMVGTGIFGVIFYYLTHFVVLKDLFKSSKSKPYQTLCYTFIAIILSYTLLSVALIYYYGKHFSFLLAVASVIGRIIKLEKEKMEKPEITTIKTLAKGVNDV